MFSISYQWFPFISIFIGLVVGILVSLATGGVKEKDSVDPRYLFKWSYRLFVNKSRVQPEVSVMRLNSKLRPSTSNEDDVKMKPPTYSAVNEQNGIVNLYPIFLYKIPNSKLIWF